jgi:hypothetical protein
MIETGSCPVLGLGTFFDQQGNSDMKGLRLAAAIAVFGLAAAPAVYAQSSYTTLPQENQTRFDAWFSRFDANSDGQITHDEYMNAQEQRFRAADLNGDGQLTKDEVLDYMAREHGGPTQGSQPAQ